MRECECCKKHSSLMTQLRVFYRYFHLQVSITRKHQIGLEYFFTMILLMLYCTMINHLEKKCSYPLSIGPQKPILCKTRHDFHSVEKKVCPKIRRLSTVILIDKVGLDYIFPTKTEQSLLVVLAQPNILTFNLCMMTTSKKFFESMDTF